MQTPTLSIKYTASEPLLRQLVIPPQDMVKLLSQIRQSSEAVESQVFQSHPLNGILVRQTSHWIPQRRPSHRHHQLNQMEFVLASLTSKIKQLSECVEPGSEAAVVAGEMESISKYLSVFAQRQKEYTEKIVDEFEDLRRDYVDAFAGQRMLRWQLEAMMATSEDTRKTVSGLELQKQGLELQVDAFVKENRDLKRKLDARPNLRLEVGSSEDDHSSQNTPAVSFKSTRWPSFASDEVAFALLKSQVSERDARIAQLEYATNRTPSFDSKTRTKI
ncbi:hypothetical protein BC830DRAFT_843668 [Chytriomyces sp. MP71]|nr:hypothetical protein BC830DRAFT_843668 [Chytriomyces sp. MP71]